MPNRLANETSPYLLQHKDNPVDWYPWGEEALARARAEDRPLLVSIGYSACHWCHVMERESFEDPEIAALMNERFVCIKVDREERPDVDAICMEACQAMTGHGGWPLNAFLTPSRLPFFAGTYFPPEQRHGMPSWPMVLRRWPRPGTSAARRSASRRPGRALAAAALADERLRSDPIPRDDARRRGHRAARRYDACHGGFGGAPKFPPHDARVPAERGEREMSLATLRAMAAGGIYDQVGGGFARYAVDATWTVPHFEKMLYDNALLARAYLHGWQVSGEERCARCAARRSTGRCARCAGRRAASAPRSTPTPRASRASSTSGRSSSSVTHSAREELAERRSLLRRDRARQLRGANVLEGARPRAGAAARDPPQALRGAPNVCGRDSTTSA
jgi:uncharacterized protein YyaL (SSP411 family)